LHLLAWTFQFEEFKNKALAVCELRFANCYGIEFFTPDAD